MIIASFVYVCSTDAVGVLIVVVLRANTIRQTQAVGLLWTSDQLVAQAAICTALTGNKNPCPWRDSKQQSPVNLRPQSHPLDLAATAIGYSYVQSSANNKMIHKCLTLRRLTSYIYGAPILDVSRSHTATQHSR